jgi:hypothetical protein
MAENTPQTFANHTRLLPAYHMVCFPLLVINLLWRLYRLYFAIDIGSGRAAPTFDTLLGIALLLLFFLARTMPLTAQDRIIRLEETMRMERLFPPNLKARIGEFTRPQFVALRFASDAELPELAAKVLDGKIEDRKAIKQMIKTWRPDYLRV